MAIEKQQTDWEQQQAQARQRMQDGGGRPGVATPEQLAGKSGRQILEAMLLGELPHAHMAETLGFDLIEVGDGQAVFQGVPQLSYYNPMGTVHGGWYATLLDSALGCAVHSKLPAGRAYTTAELSINIVRAASHTTGPMRAIGNVVHSGRQMATAEAKILDAAGRLYAHATTTCFVFDAMAAVRT
ncbi:MAG: PaaI family thioesterase [Rhodoferax sp.]|nr:PaaI family thioesterase [Rhodoferax sp.]